MNYWQQDSFEELNAVHQLVKDDLRLACYASYLELLNQGLRRDALKHIEDFLSKLKVCKDEQQSREIPLLSLTPSTGCVATSNPYPTPLPEQR